MALQGVNISGAEFNTQMLPADVNIDYVYPSQSEIAYFAARGLNVIRLPFSWERMQQRAFGPLDQWELSLMNRVVTYATDLGVSVVLDPHDYGAYHKATIGVPGGVSNAVFADFWGKLAAQYKNNGKVIFGLINEPIGPLMTPATWRASSQAAIDAIRATGATNLILVPSTYWEHPAEFVRINAAEMLKISDPANNFAYEVHQYLDFDNAPSHTDYPSEAESVAMLRSFTDWLQAHNRTAFMGEIGVSSDPAALADLSAMLQYMQAHSAQWKGYTYWTAGAWYPASYRFGVEPRNGVTSPQLQTLLDNLSLKIPGT